MRLMNRVDTKYVTTKSVLARLLSMANSEYMVQTIDSRTNMPYYTMYFDTPDCHMYMEHLHGRKRRQKIRVRKYENSGTAFLEIKKKNQQGAHGQENALNGRVAMMSAMPNSSEAIRRTSSATFPEGWKTVSGE